MIPHTVWSEINLRAIEHNVREIRKFIRAATRLMVVVKANGYGHGSVEVASRAIQHGATHLGVARLTEAVQLRKAGISVPILIFGPPNLNHVEELVNFKLTQTIYSATAAKALSSRARALGQKIEVHIKIDTGMGRLGLLPDAFWISLNTSNRVSDPLEEVKLINQLPGCDLNGIYTHFATADSGEKSYVKKQLAIFESLLRDMHNAGINPSIIHAANSAATIDHPETHLDMVRVGISTYGLYPSKEVQRNRLKLEPAMQLKTRIIQLKRVPRNYYISYGISYKTSKETLIATVPIGYADGLSRLLSSKGVMLVRGQEAPIVGRVCMDLTMINVGHIPGVALGDEVVIFGTQSGRVIPVEKVAETIDTINYEVVSTITDRVPRIYSH